jgi:hypothetical protein
VVNKALTRGVDEVDVDVDDGDDVEVDVDVDGVDGDDGVDVDVDGADVDVSGAAVGMARMIRSDLSDLDLDVDADVDSEVDSDVAPCTARRFARPFFQSSASRLASIEIDWTAGLFASDLSVSADTTADTASMPGWSPYTL